MKKKLGYFLLALPFIGLLVYAHLTGKLAEMLLAFGVALAIVAAVVAGTWLIVDK